MHRLNRFQVDMLDRLKDDLNRLRISHTEEVVGGQSEYAAKLCFNGFEVWIYEEGANVIGPETDNRFEIYDYESLDALGLSVAEFVATTLARA